jgi:hypothetical protein
MENCNIVSHSSVERPSQDMQNILTAWIKGNDNTEYGEGLPFIHS